MTCEAVQDSFVKTRNPLAEGQCDAFYQSEQRNVTLNSKYMTIHFKFGKDGDDISAGSYDSKFCFWIDGVDSKCSPFPLFYYDSLTFPILAYSNSIIVHGVLFNKVYSLPFSDKNQKAELFYSFKDGLVAIKGISNFNIVKVD